MNGRTKLLFLRRRCLAAFTFIFLTTVRASFGSTVQDVAINISDLDSISTPNRGVVLHHELQNSEAIPESTVKKEVSQEDPSPGSTLQWYTMFTKVPSDWSLFATRTFRAESIPTIAVVVGVTGALYVIDHNTYRNTHEYERGSRQYRWFTDALISAGDGKYQFGFVGSFALYGLVEDDSRALKTASQMTEAILATGIVVQVLKRIAGRESPIVATEERGALRPFPSLAEYERHQPRYYSFPSGHIATTTAALTVLCENFPEAKWLRPASCILIGAVGGSLVSKGWHWYSDLPVGIVLGYSFGRIASHPEGLDITQSGSDTSLDISVAPRLMLNGAEVEMTLRF